MWKKKKKDKSCFCIKKIICSSNVYDITMLTREYPLITVVLLQTLYNMFENKQILNACTRRWAESRNHPPPFLGIFVDHIFLTLLSTKLLSGGLQIFYAWTRSPEVIEVGYPLPLGLYKNVSYNWIETQAKYTWWHGLVVGFIGELFQSLGKVISRS